MKKKTHKVIDEVYHEDEDNVALVGTLEECNEFISEQGFGYHHVPLDSEEYEAYNKED